jgi:hypothetical protein
VRAANFWAIKEEVGYRLVPVQKDKKGKLIPGSRPSGSLHAQVHHPLSKKTGRAKGSALEIRVAKVLNAALYGGAQVLRRTPLSGGWSHGMGDICVDPEQLHKGKFSAPPLYVECKKGQNIGYENLLAWAFSGKPNFYTLWFSEALSQGKGKSVMLAVHGDGLDPWVVVRPAAGLELAEGCQTIKLLRFNAWLVPLEKLAFTGWDSRGRDGSTGDIRSG